MENFTTDLLLSDVTDFFTNSTYNSTNATGSVLLNPDNDHLIMRNLIYNHLGPFVCIFGMITNIINFAVLIQHLLPESPYMYLTVLACTDFIALMLSFIYMMFSKDAISYEWKLFDAYIFLGFVNICTTCSIMFTVQLTLERFVFVRHPLWAKDMCDHSSAKVKILVTVVSAAVFNIPRFLTHKPKEINGKWHLDSTEFRRSMAFYAINWVYSIVIHFIPLLILSVANTYLVYAVHKAGKQRQKLQIRNNREAIWQREQRRLTITLISIVFLFIICIIPSAFSDKPIAFALFGQGKTEKAFVTSSFYFELQYIANFLVWFELSLNFVLYCAFNEKFRRVMKYTAIRCIKALGIPFFHHKTENILLHVNFKSHQTRSSLLNPSNSLSTNNKWSPIQHKAIPLKKITNTGKIKAEPITNGDTSIIKSDM